MLSDSKWIKPERDMGDICPMFFKQFSCTKSIRKAELYITAMGVYEAELNKKRVGRFIMAPGWTAYNKRLQYQQYDITDMLKTDNTLTVLIGKGWCRGVMPLREYNLWCSTSAVIAKIEIQYSDGQLETIISDESWDVGRSHVLYADIYNGEYYDARPIELPPQKAVCAELSKNILIPQECELVSEHEHIKPVEYIVTPRGEHVLDFGQNLTGYVEFQVNAKYGEKISITHSETLDSKGNFYIANLRVARQRLEYICCEGTQTYKPKLTFMGFRYIRLDDFPCEVNPENFTAIVLHSEMRRTGYFECSDEMVNKLYNNVIWGQKGNYLDIPTDCPQRDERLGWTGDAQIFVKTASYNFNVEKFFMKWLADLAEEQYNCGAVTNVVPNAFRSYADENDRSWSGIAGWGDAAVICPWQIYMSYGNKEVLAKQISSMKNWVDFIRKQGDDEYLWRTGNQLGDWLATDATDGSMSGASDKYFISTAYYAYSTKLLVKALNALGEDASEYEKLYGNIISAFSKTYQQCNTQTECAMALYFDIVTDKKAVAAKLAELVRNNGNKLTTGFLGTPYILSALSENGYAKEAYSLLLQQDCPSWLFSVRMGATTMWEHWDSTNENGEFWSTEMNSFNHYAYGAVAAWLYETVCGIRTDDNHPGFERVIINPITDNRLGYAQASLDTKYGTIFSRWEIKGDETVYTIKLPVAGAFICAGRTTELEKGSYSVLKDASGKVFVKEIKNDEQI